MILRQTTKYVFALLICCADSTTLIRRAFVGFLVNIEKASRMMLDHMALRRPISVYYTTYSSVYREQACYDRKSRQLKAGYSANAGSAASKTSRVDSEEKKKKRSGNNAHTTLSLVDIRCATCMR